MACGLKGQLHNALILVRCSQVKNREDVLPAWAYVCSLGVNHLGYAAYHHVSDCGRSGEEMGDKEEESELDEQTEWKKELKEEQEKKHKEEENRCVCARVRKHAVEVN